MKRILLTVSLLVALSVQAIAASKANSVLIRPGEVVYARFESEGKKIKLVGISKEKAEGANVIFSFQLDEKKPSNTLKVENKFTRHFLYKVEMRSLSTKRRFPYNSSPVVAGKVAFEDFPKIVEELALFGFALEK